MHTRMGKRCRRIERQPNPRNGETMIIEHAGKRPTIDPTASIALDATICEDVSIGPNTRVLYGARIIGESGRKIQIGSDCIVMENAVIRATANHPCAINDACLIGPNAHVVGAVLHLRAGMIVPIGQFGTTSRLLETE
jgi:carbonic anhydrase/acetyltransferase-like protein (isoleucine patch superfamily)